MYKENIIAWIENDLSTPNPRFNNLPRCPYAKRAVMDNKILFENIQSGFYNVVKRLVETWDDSYDIAVLNLDYNVTPNAVGTLRTICNEGYADKDFIFIEDFVPQGNHSVILMQRKTNIDKARIQLKSKGYYAGDPQK
tara:strand:+ start:1367 stop:1780 length:414 start_codon:yes stop_codon:yes gene_type:complete